ncbi:hypothetical protein LWI29_031803 [Acer saccharum]|uniref:Uncharacterized protein n=1 Tax=Acer saccharum TaxID=4024 RepID=A0AA39TAH8_ACESA|nr:hypothetical protein LWI29_031803 [Acer saccharum]
MEQRLCAEMQQFEDEDEDEAETGDELQFDGEEMVNEDWVEGDVGPMLMVRPDFITINDDPKLELVEEKCHAAPKVDKEASLGIGDQSAPKFNNIWVVDSGNTAEEHGSAMVETLVCILGQLDPAAIIIGIGLASSTYAVNLKQLDVFNCEEVEKQKKSEEKKGLEKFKKSETREIFCLINP